jgi:hypothetical protein
MDREMSKHTVQHIGDEWTRAQEKLAFSHGKGSDKSLIVRVRFNGTGAEIVNYIVEDHGEETVFDTYDAAVSQYNLLP